jgi:hypothetical protein
MAPRGRAPRFVAYYRMGARTGWRQGHTSDETGHLAARELLTATEDYLPGAFSGAAFGYERAGDFAGAGGGRQSALRDR